AVRKTAPSGRQEQSVPPAPAAGGALATAARQAGAPSGADKAGRRAFPHRPSRILGRMFPCNADITPPLHAADETGSEHGASPSRRVCLRMRLACQEPFVSVASAIKAVPDEFVCTEGTVGWALVTGAFGCSTGSREARTAASILARTFC